MENSRKLEYFFKYVNVIKCFALNNQNLLELY